MTKKKRFKVNKNVLLFLIILVVGISAKLEAQSNRDDYSIYLQRRTVQIKALSKHWNKKAIQESIDLHLQNANYLQQHNYISKLSFSLREASKLSIKLGAWQNAENYALRSLKIEQKSTNKSELVKTLSLLSRIATQKAKRQTSILYFEKAISLSKNLSDLSAKAEAQRSAAEYFYYLEQDTKKAINLFENSIANWKLAKAKIGELETTLELGFILTFSLPNKALDLGKYSLSESRKIKNIRLEALSLHLIGSAHSDLNNSQLALKFARESELLFPTDVDRIENAKLLNLIAYVYINFREHSSALFYTQKSLKLYKKENHLLGQIANLATLVKLSFLDEKPELAQKYFSKIKQMSPKVGDIYYLSIAKGKMATFYTEQKQYKKALNNYNESLKNLTELKFNKGVFDLNIGLGNLYLKENQLHLAENYFQKSLVLSKKIDTGFPETEALFNLAKIETQKKEFNMALTLLKESISKSEKLLSSTANDKLSSSYISKIFERFELYTNLLMKKHLVNKKNYYALQAFRNNEKARNRIMLQKLLLSTYTYTNKHTSPLIKEEQQITEKLNKSLNNLTKENKQNKSKIVKSSEKNEINELQNQLEELKSKIKQQNPYYSEIRNSSEFDLVNFQENILNRNDLLVEISFGKEESYVWLISKDSFEVFVLPKREVLETQIDKLLELLVASRIQKESESNEEYLTRVSESDIEFTKQAKILSANLFGQFAEKVKGKRLIIVPDGKLRYFPISALPFPNEDEPFLFTNEVVYVPSASTLNLLRMTSENRVKAKKDFLVLADPIYTKDDDRFASKMEDSEKQDVEIAENVEKPYWNNFRSMEDLNSLGRLQASREEADSILDIFGSDKSEVVTDFEANRDDFKKTELADYKVLHFATHGYLNEERPELSGIVLSKFDKSGNEQDGFIRLQDIYELKLNADLVVLSACDTGVGKEVKGEGLMSLTNGFLQTGAKTVISSRWKVSDQATLYLMKHFYKNLADENLTPSEALRKAQITMSKHPLYESPFHWAAFTVQGEYQTKLNLSRRFNYSGYLLFLSLVLVLFGVYRGYRNYGNYSMRKG